MLWPVAEGVVTRVLMEQAGQQPRRQIGVVGLIEETAPGVGVEAAHALAEAGCMFMPSAVSEVIPRKMNVE